MNTLKKLINYQYRMTKLSGPFIGSIDQGTSSSRFIIFDKQGKVVTFHQEEFKGIFQKPG
jgi:glycerol kinase